MRFISARVNLYGNLHLLYFSPILRVLSLYKQLMILILGSLLTTTAVYMRQFNQNECPGK